MVLKKFTQGCKVTNIILIRHSSEIKRFLLDEIFCFNLKLLGTFFFSLVNTLLYVQSLSLGQFIKHKPGTSEGCIVLVRVILIIEF